MVVVNDFIVLEDTPKSQLKRLSSRDISEDRSR